MPTPHSRNRPKLAKPTPHERREQETDDILRLFDSWAIRLVLGIVGLYLLYEIVSALMN